MENRTRNVLGEVLCDMMRMLRSAGLLSAYTAGRVASNTAAGLLTIVVLCILVCNLFLFLNIALGFWLGSLWGGSPAGGFLILAGIYALLIVIYWCLRPTIEGAVRNIVARRAARLAKRSAQVFDASTYNVGAEESVPEFMQRSVDYQELCSMENAERQRLVNHVDVLKFDVQYLKENYKDVAVSTVQDKMAAKYPKSTYILPLLSLFRSKKNAKKSEPELKVQNNQNFKFSERIANLTKYMPIAKGIYDVAGPVLWGFAVLRMQGLLASLLGMKGWKSKRK